VKLSFLKGRMRWKRLSEGRALYISNGITFNDHFRVCLKLDFDADTIVNELAMAELAQGVKQCFYNAVAISPLLLLLPKQLGKSKVGREALLAVSNSHIYIMINMLIDVIITDSILLHWVTLNQSIYDVQSKNFGELCSGSHWALQLNRNCHSSSQLLTLQFLTTIPHPNKFLTGSSSPLALWGLLQPV
jgi:hypothetical protein